jgi:hypothetical protein
MKGSRRVRNRGLRASREKRLGTPAELDTPENKEDLWHNISASHLRELLMTNQVLVGRS